MKKAMFAILGLVVLAGCSSYYDYYKGGVRYTQDGDDCVFRSVERGRHYSNDISKLDMDKRVVYRNTMCSDLYVRDNANVESRNVRRVLAPAAASVENNGGCCAKKCAKKKYVFVK